VRARVADSWWAVIVVGVLAGAAAGAADAIGGAVEPVSRRPSLSVILDAIDRSPNRDGRAIPVGTGTESKRVGVR
jgi:hypothetical protein